MTKVHPLEGVATEVSFTSDIKGIGKFLSGKNLGSGTMTKYPSWYYRCGLACNLTTENAEEFMWWAHEKKSSR